MCGGISDSLSNAILAYFPTEKTWKMQTHLTEGRYCHGAVVLDEEIYIIGGTGFYGVQLQSCEKYNPKSNKLILIPPLLSIRSQHGVAVLNGKIYVCGGKTDRRTSTNTAEVFDPATNQWSYVAPMNTERCCLSLVSHDRKLFAIGGYDCSQNVALSSVEVYDVDQNSWNFVAPLPKSTYSMCSCVVWVFCAVFYIFFYWFNKFFSK